MGQHSSRGSSRLSVDPGPLGDEEVALALKAYEEFAACEVGGFSSAFGLPEESYGKALYAVAAKAKEELSRQGLITFLGETTRGGRSKRLTHVLCAAVGVADLIDPATGEPRCVGEDKFAKIFELAWQFLLSKHHLTAEGFDDDDDTTINASSRDVLYGGGNLEGATTTPTTTPTNGRPAPKTPSKRWSAMQRIDAAPFVESIFEAARVEAAREKEARRGAEAVADGDVLDSQGRLDLSFAARWADRHAPELADAWTAYVRSALFRDYAGVFQAPRLWDSSDIFGGGNDDGTAARRSQMMCGLALAAPECRGDWKRLYASGVDGLSFYRLCHQILGWSGATCVLVKSQKGEIFGAVLNESWKEWHTYYGGGGGQGGGTHGTSGGGDDFLFALRPTFRICRLRRGPGSRRDAQFLNTKSLKFKGLCVGSSDGTPEYARLAVPDALGDAVVHVRRSDLTFEAGELAPLSGVGDNAVVPIDSLEVWGIGHDADAITKSSEARDNARQTRAAHVRRAGQVDKAKFLENSFDREHLLGKTFAACAPDVRRDERRPEAD